MKRSRQEASRTDRVIGPSRGVVLSVQVPELGSLRHPTAAVLLYDPSGVLRNQVLHEVLITFSLMQVHDGVLLLPTPSRNFPDDLLEVDPFTLDGSHVIVDFLQRGSQPFISRYLWHPFSDHQKSAATFDQRVRPRQGDTDTGAPLPIACVNGIRVYISGSGELTIDTRGSRASAAGKLDEPDASTSAGPVKIITRPDATVTIEGGPVTITSDQVNVGTAATHPAVHGDVLAAAHASFDTQLALVLNQIVTALATIPVAGPDVSAALGSAITAAQAAGLRLSATNANSTVVKLG